MARQRGTVGLRIGGGNTTAPHLAKHGSARVSTRTLATWTAPYLTRDFVPDEDGLAFPSGQDPFVKGPWPDGGQVGEERP